MTEEERHSRRLETYRKYNLSKNGRDRYERYEKKHPERAERWSPIMQIRARQGRILCRSSSLLSANQLPS